jgi:hypothetical protein
MGQSSGRNSRSKTSKTFFLCSNIMRGPEDAINLLLLLWEKGDVRQIVS